MPNPLAALKDQLRACADAVEDTERRFDAVVAYDPQMGKGQWRTRPDADERDDAAGDVRIVYNRLLGGWYVVRGPQQTPLSGRFGSKGEAEAWFRDRKTARGDAVDWDDRLAIAQARLKDVERGSREERELKELIERIKKAAEKES